MSNDYIIKNPVIKDKKWRVFPDSMFSNVESVGCNDSIEGKCYANKTFNQCIKLCDESPICSYGYYISNIQSKNKNLCVPLSDKKSKINPVYRLRNKDIYPEMKNLTTKVFIDKKHPFPPVDSNTVFFMDNFNIKNIETGMFLETSPMSSTGEEVKFDKNGDLIVQVLQVPSNLSTGVRYNTVKYGDPLVFNIPNTTLIMKNDEDSGQMKWTHKSSDISEDVSYKIYPIMPNKKIGDIVSFSDIFSIRTNVSILGINSISSIEKLYYSNYQQAIEKKENVMFSFIPKMKGWYCDNNDNKCKEIPLDKTTLNTKGISTYNGFEVSRNPVCWNMCDGVVSNDNKIGILWIIIPILLVIILIICFIKFSL
jgi:hypothetical protein